jgi:hypothetical protein
MRPGEKLFEELEMTEELLVKTRHPKIFIGKIKSYPQQQLQYALDRLTQLSMNSEEGELRKFLTEILPEARLTLIGPSPHRPPLTSVGVRGTSLWARNTELVQAEQAS